MSEETETAIDTAISQHVAETFPGFYTEGWVIVTVSSTLDNPHGKNYRILTPDSQPFHADLGLITVGKQILEDQWCDGGDEDDD